MACRLNEIAVSKCVSVKLSDDTVALVAHMYHTADRSQNPNDESFYMYEGRVAKIADIEAEIAQMKSFDYRLKLWKWPDPTWPTDWFMGYDGDNNQMKGQRFLKMKLKKMLKWEDYVLLVTKGIKTLGTGKKKAYPSGKYETEGYTDQDGKTFSILDREALLARCGKCFTKKMPLKRASKKRTI